MRFFDERVHVSPKCRWTCYVHPIQTHRLALSVYNSQFRRPSCIIENNICIIKCWKCVLKYEVCECRCHSSFWLTPLFTTSCKDFHFKELHLGFREFHLMFLRRVQKPDGRWAKQVSKERHRLGESERWQSCQDNAISNGCAPRCLQSAEGSEAGSDTRLGSRGHWQAPAVPERTGEKW